MNVIDVTGLIAAYRDRSSNFGRSGVPLSDHLPMAVAALIAMGATEERACAWARAYAELQQLHPAGAAELAGRARWRERIERDGVHETLGYAIRTLGDGLGAAAFHPVIRAAYAFERGDRDELAAAFESWQREFLTLPISSHVERTGVRDALAALAKLKRPPDLPFLIAEAMALIAAGDGFADVAARVPFASEIDDLALAAAAAFASSQNFTALHVMTGTYALRSLCVHVDDPDALMPAFWCAFAAAATVAGTPPTLDADVLAGLRAGAPPAWGPLLEEAIAHDDDHVIKAVYTAWRLDGEIGDPVFRAAAANYLRKMR